MRKFKTISATKFTVSFALDFGGRVAAARRFRPARECSLLRFYDFEGPRSAPYPVA